MESKFLFRYSLNNFLRTRNDNTYYIILIRYMTKDQSWCLWYEGIVEWRRMFYRVFCLILVVCEKVAKKIINCSNTSLMTSDWSPVTGDNDRNSESSKYLWPPNKIRTKDENRLKEEQMWDEKRQNKILSILVLRFSEISVGTRHMSTYLQAIVLKDCVRIILLLISRKSYQQTV